MKRIKRGRSGGAAVTIRHAPPPRRTFAALDLGTNNCRLLVAEPAGASFRVLDGYSQIVRLGEGLSATGRLSEAAIARTMGALGACVEKIMRARPIAVGCIATQACRAAENGSAFLERVDRELGLNFQVISPAEEARLAVLGCAGLLDPAAEAALIVDIGGGSTELSFVEPASVIAARLNPPVLAWASAPIGVVTLAESAPEPADNAAWYEGMVASLKEVVAAMEAPTSVRAAFAAGRAHIVGTSGAITSLAGVHLNLPRYQRAKVDGVWLSREEVRAATQHLRRMSPGERARHPCIGPERADLVLPGCAILEAICEVWPVERLRVADRGLREGMLIRLMAPYLARSA
ncbi:MAG: Ppx/GppA family phosphatase [Hyphomonadaceae bacterium]